LTQGKKIKPLFISEYNTLNATPKNVSLRGAKKDGTSREDELLLICTLTPFHNFKFF